MQSRWRIFVLSLAIFSLLVPAPAFCAQVQQSDHACCASQAQLSAPSCCQPGSASQPAAQAQSSNPSNAELAPLQLRAGWTTMPSLLLTELQRTVPPPILLPATILRT